MRKLIFIGLLAAGCAPVQPAGEGRGADLARTLQGLTAGETQTCISTSSARSLRVVDPGTLVADGGGTVWVNRLRGECPGLDAHGTLIVEPSSGQYCRGDRFRQLEWGSTIAGPYCVLGDFTAYRRPR